MRSAARFFLLIAILSLAFAARAQEPAPARLTAASMDEGETIQLTYRWRFHPGHDPSWSSAGADDEGWETVAPEMGEGQRPRGGWPGVGWFRRHVVLDESLRSAPLVVNVEAPGRAEVYVDGALVLVAGAGRPGVTPVSPLPAPGPSRALPRAGAWARVDLAARAEHVIAVRYECPCGDVPGRIGFRLSLERVGALESRAVSLRRDAFLYGVFLAIPALLAALHFGLFTFYPKSRENLFCALCLLSFAVIVAGEFGDDLDAQGWLFSVVPYVVFAAVLAAIFFGLATYFAIRLERTPRTWILFAVVAAALAPFGPVLSERGRIVAWTLYFGASLVEIVRNEVVGRKLERDSAFPLLIGMLLLDAAIAVQILIAFGAMPAPFGFSEVYLFGILAFSVATSLFIVRSFARTSVSLERRLAEVQSLTSQVIASERESARRGMEIEAARTLQASILPSGLPRVPGLDVAAKITTASEVGGDYYDFHVAGDGSLVVAVGDAAGHGVAAGAMVTATKALFSLLARERDLANVLAQCDRALRAMNVRPLHMCLLLARVTPERLTVASAAMPYVLLRHAGDGTVEEIVAGGTPLASGLPGSWQERSVSLSSGDTLLFASDGLAEALSPEGDPLGYAAVASMFAEAAGSASSIAAELARRVDSWRGERERNDDVAVVVVRVAV